MFVFIDETSSDDYYIRKFGYFLRGLRAESHCYMSRILAIAAMDCTGLKLIKGTVDSHIFFEG